MRHVCLDAIWKDQLFRGFNELTDREVNVLADRVNELSQNAAQIFFHPLND